MTRKELENLCKAQAIATFTCYESTPEAYDKLMNGESDFIIWEPFENYDSEALAELVSSEFSSLLEFAKQVRGLT